ncbi:hypothetical protein T07_8171 [Trichinella nelsoni]|uniref:Uncharacterized protein n=1 Tax=Trichinella nelsoni TaxID=6336 RepID=A0A0V0RWR3_9BILA|nr:hypothetical protein T07_8171 [Trichinella nelsoni]
MNNLSRSSAIHFGNTDGNVCQLANLVRYDCSRCFSVCKLMKKQIEKHRNDQFVRTGKIVSKQIEESKNEQNDE